MNRDDILKQMCEQFNNLDLPMQKQIIIQVTNQDDGLRGYDYINAIDIRLCWSWDVCESYLYIQFKSGKNGQVYCPIVGSKGEAELADILDSIKYTPIDNSITYHCAPSGVVHYKKPKLESKQCICEMNILMLKGCQCGGL